MSERAPVRWHDVLSDESYARIRAQILPGRDELRWRRIPWRRSLLEGVRDARASASPLLLWAMDGHPLGSVCNNGIAARQSVWGDPVVQRLAIEFVPAADDAGALGREVGPAGELFRAIGERGHFAGRSVPTNTRQGIYATTPDGRVLASINSIEAGAVRGMLATALERWRGMSAGERIASLGNGVSGGSDAVATSTAGDGRGTLLRVYSRDLPRDGDDRGATLIRSWNQDRAWIGAAELRLLAPEGTPGARRQAPSDLVARIARFHLLDNVRGQAEAFGAGAIEAATLRAETVSADGEALALRLAGRIRAVQCGSWPVRGAADRDDPAPQERGYDMTLLGHASYAHAAGSLLSFELIAAGMRWGASQYNDRADDLGPAPMGIAFVLESDA